ncbi:fructoselysine 6-kinase [Agrococcus baldri]|uniref:Fructoselysine 6-kinase n=1 Tax=Agrococcus baldri TaxID=153730 RepID=A0AA94KYL8_9MICO|nr:PfkB family carbohydrate kinase [Agrococcus baldri]SFS00017.1 fructoselysine 6-kinase [Agrococcus baldri]
MTSQPLDVAVVGDNTLDRYLDEPEIGDLIGGNALNVAVQLAMMGLRVGYFGAVGDDENASAVANAAAARGVVLDGLVTMPGSTALTTISRTEQGDRRFETEEFGVTAEYYPTSDALEMIGASRWVHVGMLPRSRAFGASIAAMSPVPVSQDCSVSPESHRLAVAFASAGEDAVVAEAMVLEMLENGARTAVATLGPEGALAGRGAQRWRAMPMPVSVVDTTGAGDAFMAGFIAATLDGENVEGALAAGVARGSYACQHVGGWPQRPAEIASFG